MSAIKETIHSARQMVAILKHEYPPTWQQDANKILDEAAAELAAKDAEIEALRAGRLSDPLLKSTVDPLLEQIAVLSERVRVLENALFKASSTVNEMAYIFHDADTDDQEKFEKLENEWMQYPIIDIGSLLDDAIHAGRIKADK